MSLFFQLPEDILVTEWRIVVQQTCSAAYKTLSKRTLAINEQPNFSIDRNGNSSPHLRPLQRPFHGRTIWTDGHPSGQGCTVLKFLARPENIQRLKAGLERIKVIATKEVEGLAALSEEDRQLLQSSPSCSRDTGAKILEMIALAGDTAEGQVPIVLDVEFARDGLFCEWAYVIDLEEGVFEVYGGQFALERRKLSPGGERFGEGSGVGMIRSFALDKLPEDLVDAVGESDED